MKSLRDFFNWKDSYFIIIKLLTEFPLRTINSKTYYYQLLTLLPKVCYYMPDILLNNFLFFKAFVFLPFNPVRDCIIIDNIF